MDMRSVQNAIFTWQVVTLSVFLVQSTSGLCFDAMGERCSTQFCDKGWLATL